MLNIGAGELIFILVAALLVLGPKRLPELARSIGKFVREFRRQTDEVRGVVEREFYQINQEVSFPPPFERPIPGPAPSILPAATPTSATEGAGAAAVPPARPPEEPAVPTPEEPKG